MLTNFFDGLTRLSVRGYVVTIALSLAVLAAGLFAYSQLNQELVPAVEFPQTIVIAQWPDAPTTDAMLAEVTLPLEQRLQAVEGIVNVESTTNERLVFIIARNEFGLESGKIVAAIEAAAAETALPQGVEPEIITFSLSDLPVVIASISASDRSLVDLKALVDESLVPQLTAIDLVSEVSISGGQELPEGEELAPLPVDATLPSSRLSRALIAGLAVYDVDVAYAEDITAEDTRSLIYKGGRLALRALELLTPENLRAGRPAALAYLPSDFTETLDADLQSDLNQRAAEYGGIGQFTFDEAETAKEAEIDVLTGLPVEAGTIADLPPAAVEDAFGSESAPEPESAVTEVESVEAEEAATGVALPDSWIEALSLQGMTVATTADLTPQIVGGIAQFAPQLLAELTPEMVAALPADVAAVLPAGAEAESAEAVALPSSWIAAFAAQGTAIATTDDLTAEMVGGIVQFAPQLLGDLTDEMILALPVDVAAELPQGEQVVAAAPVDDEAMAAVEPLPLPDELVALADEQGLTAETTADLTPLFIATLDEEELALLSEAMVVQLPLDALAALPDETVAALDAEAQLALGARLLQAEPVPLPQGWLEEANGSAVETTADLTTAYLTAVADLRPELLELLTPAQLLSLPLESVAILPATYQAGLPPTVQRLLVLKGEAVTAMTQAEPTDLPPSWQQMAAAQGVELTSAGDLSAETVGAIAAFSPEMLDELTPAMLLALPPEALLALPAERFANLDQELQTELLAALELDSFPVDDPRQLPALYAELGAQVGEELDTVDDVSPEFVRQLGAFGAQGVELLSLLSADNLRLLDAEVIALLPADFLETIEDDALRVYLDGLALDYGGAGALLLQEQAAAAALSADAPLLGGAWPEPNANGDPSQFITAADLINNPFTGSAAELLNFIPGSPQVDDPRDWIGVIDVETIRFLTQNEADFAANLLPNIAELLPAESVSYLLENYADAYDDATRERLQKIAGGARAFVPESTITRNNGNPSLVLMIFKRGDANTVNTFHAVDEVMAAFSREESDINFDYVFEQSTFIEESIAGVTREGLLGAVFAILIILVFLSGRVRGRYRLSLRATIITGLSIPSSVLFAFLLMWLVPVTVGPWLNRIGGDNLLLSQLAKLFPAEITLNIMTLSGLTVAIGRVVDDSIVVLENSYRYIQKGLDPREAVYRGTKEVAVAIFAATVTTMAVFLPLGFVGGLISQFFLPFGLTVTYALAASFIVSITLVPALTALLIRKENIPEERETALQRGYTPLLRWTLANRWLTLGVATLIFVGSLSLLTRLPNSFIPSLGEPTINVTVNLPAGTSILDTNRQVAEFEGMLRQEVSGLETVLTEVGTGGGTEALFGGGAGAVTPNVAALTITTREGGDIDEISAAVRESAESFFGVDQVRVGAAAQSGFSGFALIVTGDTLDEVIAEAATVETTLAQLDADGSGTPDLINISSNADAAANGSTVIRIDGRPAISFGADLVTEDTIGVTEAAIGAVAAKLPPGLTATQGFDSQSQTEGFQDMISAIGVSIVLVYLIMALTFRSFIHPFTILFSLPFALVGAAVALFITSSVLGISAMMGLLMLVGVVVTNGIVLLELVQQLREEQGMGTYEALVEGGRTRIRPIWMTALTAILALIPLALSSEGGAIIAAELGTAVIGGLLVSTALTLIVIPVVYSLLDGVMVRYLNWQYRRLGRRLGYSGD